MQSVVEIFTKDDKTRKIIVQKNAGTTKRTTAAITRNTIYKTS